MSSLQLKGSPASTLKSLDADIVRDLAVHKLSPLGGWVKRRLVVTDAELLICTPSVRSSDLRQEGTFGMIATPVHSHALAQEPHLPKPSV